MSGTRGIGCEKMMEKVTKTNEFGRKNSHCSSNGVRQKKHKKGRKTKFVNDNQSGKQHKHATVFAVVQFQFCLVHRREFFPYRGKFTWQEIEKKAEENILSYNIQQLVPCIHTQYHS